jgi:hypothetical protein
MKTEEKQVRGLVRRITLYERGEEEIYCSKLFQAVSARSPIESYARRIIGYWEGSR